MRWAIVAVMAVGLLLGAHLSPVEAQTPPPPPQPATPSAVPALQPGDIIWAFAQEPPFNDHRVAMAFGLMFEQRIAQGSPLRIFAADEQNRQFLAQRPVRTDQIPLLFDASGFPNAAFTVAGPCKYWAPPNAGVAPAMAPEQAAEMLSAAMREGLQGFGKQIEPCTRTTNPAEAHLLVWTRGGPPPVIPTRREPTFLTAPGLSPSASLAQPSGRGGNALHPANLPNTGSFGASSTHDVRNTLVPGVIVLAVALVAWRLIWTRVR